MTSEFQEVAHCGGHITFTISTLDDGRRAYNVTYSSSRPVPMAMIGLYALSQGIPVGPVKRFGLPNMEPPPCPDALLVLIGSDSHGLFGHSCPRCEGYWRSGPWPQFCPYCALNTDGIDFLSKAQRRYISYYCSKLADALGGMDDGEIVIDMDAVADAVADPLNRPAFYVSEESQQHKFRCKACNEYNDILGTYGYCSACGTRNDISVFEDETLPKIRERLKKGSSAEDCIRDAVAAADSLIGNYAREIAAQVPLVKARERRLKNGRFHDFTETVGLFQGWFGIDVTSTLKNDDEAFAALMFHRRHVYEHKGGEADEKYIRDSGDAVRPKQQLRNSPEDAHRLVGIIQRVGRCIHAGFHEMLPPDDGPINIWKDRQERMKRGGG